MTVYEFLRIELGYNVDVNGVIPDILNAEIDTHREEYTSGFDIDKCAIVFHFTKEAIAKNRLLSMPQVWRYYKFKTDDDKWHLDYIE